MREECIFDKLGADLRYLEIHDSAYLFNDILLFIFADVPWLITIFVYGDLVRLVVEWIRIVQGLLRELEVEDVTCEEGADDLGLTVVRIRVFIHNY